MAPDWLRRIAVRLLPRIPRLFLDVTPSQELPLSERQFHLSSANDVPTHKVKRVDRSGRVDKVRRTRSSNARGDRKLHHGVHQGLQGNAISAARLDDTEHRARCEAGAPIAEVFGDTSESKDIDTGHQPPNLHGGIGSVQRQPYTMEMARRDAANYRMDALEKYNKAMEALESWRDNFASIREEHERGLAPNVDGWNLDCSRSAFDRQHLREAMKRSGEAVRQEKYVYNMLQIARKVGLAPLDWQTRYFSRRDPHYYTESQENAMAATAPLDAIYRWGDQLPDDPEAMGGDELPDADHNPAGYGGDHGVEVPKDADLELDVEVQPGDSWSCVADDFTLVSIVERRAFERRD